MPKKTSKPPPHGDRKRDFIKVLAEYLVSNQALMSIGLGQAAQRHASFRLSESGRS